MSYFMSLSVTVLSLETCAIVLEAAAQWSGEVVLVECGEHDRCDLKAWICPAPFLCSHHLDCATLRVFNGLFPAIVFRCRAAIMQIRGHVIYRALMTRSNSRKLHESWLHIDIIGQHYSGWSTVMLGFMGVHEWARWLINYNYQRPVNSPQMIITSSVLYCSGGKSLSGA